MVNVVIMYSLCVDAVVLRINYTGCELLWGHKDTVMAADVLGPISPSEMGDIVSYFCKSQQTSSLSMYDIKPKYIILQKLNVKG